MNIPVSADDITAEWLSEQLDCQVSRLNKMVDADSSGLVSTMCFLDVDFESPTKIPRKLVAKLMPDSAGSFELATTFQLFVHECNFYKNVAPRLPIRTPRSYFAEADEASGVGCLIEGVCNSILDNGGIELLDRISSE